LHETAVLQRLLAQFPTQIIRENILKNKEFLNGIRELQPKNFCKQKIVGGLSNAK